VSDPMKGDLPYLPLLLWDTPPGLELILGQEGVPYRAVTDPHPHAFGGGRFVLFDGRRRSASAARSRLTRGHALIDVNLLRRDFAFDPFAALVDDRAASALWEVGGFRLHERVSRHPKAALRRRVVDRLREAVASSGGLWARLGAYPHPYRSAFNFRADLDETHVADYARFARARRGVGDCCTHFVSTRAYGDQPAVLQDLRRFDTQSHGHHHVVYRDEPTNRRNLGRADALLRESGFEPVGFAAPHGRWNAGLDRVLEDLGYLYSSDFQLGYDDLPFFPWRGDRFSGVLQVPVHPVSEGLFLDAGAADGRAVAAHLAAVVAAKVDAGEPAFVYGHPERRLGRYPEVLAAVSGAAAGVPLLWRVTLTEFARWWRWRAERRWSVVDRGDGRFEVQFDEWSGRYALALEVVRGRHVSSLPVTGPRTALRLGDLAYERREPRAELPSPRRDDRRPGLKAAIRSAIDWETVTPVEELPAYDLASRLKKGLRLWHHARAGRAAARTHFRAARRDEAAR